MVYKYFVSYNYYVGNSLGSGSMEFLSNKEIDSFSDIEYMCSKVKEKNKFTSVIIMNFVLLSVEKAGDINE